MNSHIQACQRLVAKVAASQLDALSTSDRILVCEGIASLYPEQSSEAITARQHAADLRQIERQQMLLTDLLKSS